MNRLSTAACLSAVLFTSPATGAAPVNLTVQQCWKGNDHPGLWRCVNERAMAARKRLESTELSIRKAIANDKADPPAYLDAIRKNFEASVSSYRQYRSNQCQLREALAAMGNGSAEIKLACEAELDTNRANELKAGLRWLR